MLDLSTQLTRTSQLCNRTKKVIDVWMSTDATQAVKLLLTCTGLFDRQISSHGTESERSNYCLKLPNFISGFLHLHIHKRTRNEQCLEHASEHCHGRKQESFMRIFLPLSALTEHEQTMHFHCSINTLTLLLLFLFTSSFPSFFPQAPSY